MEIQVDNREDKKILKYLEKEGIEYKLMQLDVGDYYIPERGLCIERKTVLDLIGSYCTGHMQEQLENMQLNFERPYLFISGKYDYFEIKRSHYKYINAQSVHKMKLHILEDYPKVRIVEFDNDHQLVLGVKDLASYIPKQKEGKPIIKRTQTFGDVYLTCLCSLPGVSIVRASKIMVEYPSLFLLAEGLKTDKKILKGIAKSNKEAILKLLKT